MKHVINFSIYIKKRLKARNMKELSIAVICCLLLFQPANDSISQKQPITTQKIQLQPRDNSALIKQIDKGIDSSLANLKEVEKKFDKALRLKVVYKTRWLTPKVDTVYVPVPDSLNVPDFFDYKYDVPDTVFIRDTVFLERKKKSWFKSLINKL